MLTFFRWSFCIALTNIKSFEVSIAYLVMCSLREEVYIVLIVLKLILFLQTLTLNVTRYSVFLINSLPPDVRLNLLIMLLDPHKGLFL